MVAAPYLRQHAAQVSRGAHADRALAGLVGTEGVFLHGRRGEGEQHEPDTGGREREAAPDPVGNGAGVERGEPLDEQSLVLVPHGEQHVLAGDMEEILHERHGHGSQSVTARSQRSGLQQAQPHDVPAVLEPFQGAHLDE